MLTPVSRKKNFPAIRISGGRIREFVLFLEIL